MCRSIPLCALVLLLVSCQHPQPTARWAGSRKSERITLMETCPGISPEMALMVYPDIDEAAVRASWPWTVEEAVTRLISDMDEADKQRVRETKKEDLVKFHNGWGAGIRNEFGLWKGNTHLMADCHVKHPDDASMVIIERVWERLQKQ